jgi:thiamine biosynthesis lipoprotein
MIADRAVANSPADADGAELYVARRTSWALGSNVSIAALHADRRVAEAAIDDAFVELELVEEVMSLYRPHSQLCRLNREGRLDDPHPYLLEVLRYARETSLRSGGAFDVTVQPLWSLYSSARKQARLPDADEVAAARHSVDWRRVDVSDRCVRLHGEGTAITLNGIAQGFASDRAAAALEARGVEHALIDTGEVNSLGTGSRVDGWNVGIQHPREADAYVYMAQLQGRCLATSGDYATAFSDDFRLNHLFDPRTGRSPESLASVSIAAPTGMAADALSTAVFVLGPRRGLALVDSTPGADALFVLKNGRMLKTEGFPPHGEV